MKGRKWKENPCWRFYCQPCILTALCLYFQGFWHILVFFERPLVKESSYHAGHQEFSRCCTKGGSEKSTTQNPRVAGLTMTMKPREDLTRKPKDDFSKLHQCHGGQLPWWSSSYDAHLECERLGFDPPLRHWIFWSIGTHCYIWHPIMGFINLFVWSKCEDTLSPEGVNVMADSCLGGLVVVTLVQNVRDWGSIPSWGTEFFGPSEPTVTLMFAILCNLYSFVRFSRKCRRANYGMLFCGSYQSKQIWMKQFMLSK